MTRASRQQVSVETTPYYHAINRCGRRAFLCGEGAVTGASCEHRKGWVVAEWTGLAGVLAIDVCAYAVMSKHYHLLLRINEGKALGLTDEEVAQRWMALFRGHPLVFRC